MPKGLPDNVSIEVKTESDEWGIDGHSHSFLTLKELLDYSGETHIVRGVVSEKYLKKMMK